MSLYILLSCSYAILRSFKILVNTLRVHRLGIKVTASSEIHGASGEEES